MADTITMPKFDLDAPGAFRSLVEAMTNHERNLWARRKYPGLRLKDAKVIAELFPQTVRRRTGYVATLDEVKRLAIGR